MPKIDVASLPVFTGSSYPGALADLMVGRSQQAIGDAGGLTQFGANLVHLTPGAMSALRHWHEQQDEVLVMTEGTLILIENEGETEMQPGDCATFKAGDPNGHQLVNRTDQPASFFVVGTRTPTERAHYPDHEMMVTVDADGGRFTNSDGTPVT